MASVPIQASKLKKVVLDLLFPQWCIGCGREGGFFCPDCRRSLVPMSPPVSTEGAGTPGELDGIRSAFVFQGVMRRAIHELKYRNIRALAEPLAGLLNENLTAHPLPADVLVPVPLHPKRLRERGYNQSALLARELGRLTGLPVTGDCLIRLRHAPPQAKSAGAEERRRQVAGAFACRDGRLRGRRVMLIDDVTTSGATLAAAAAALKSAGAAAVWGVTVAKDI